MLHWPTSVWSLASPNGSWHCPKDWHLVGGKSRTVCNSRGTVACRVHRAWLRKQHQIVSSAHLWTAARPEMVQRRWQLSSRGGASSRCNSAIWSGALCCKIVLVGLRFYTWLISWPGKWLAFHISEMNYITTTNCLFLGCAAMDVPTCALCETAKDVLCGLVVQWGVVRRYAAQKEFQAKESNKQPQNKTGKPISCTFELPTNKSMKQKSSYPSWSCDTHCIIWICGGCRHFITKQCLQVYFFIDVNGTAVYGHIGDVTHGIKKVFIWRGDLYVKSKA